MSKTLHTFRLNVTAAGGLPAWVPAPGEMAEFVVGGGVLQNNFRDTFVSYSSAYYDVRIISDYSGGVAAPDAGDFGAIVFIGAGHSASNINQVTALIPDQSGLKFVRLSNPTAWFGTATDQTNQMANSINDITSLVDPDWLDTYPFDGTYAMPGWHTYDGVVAVPPSKGGAAYGTMVAPWPSHPGYINLNGPLNTPGGSHQFAINSLTDPALNTWSRAANAPFAKGGGWQGPSLAAYVPGQDRVYWSFGGAANVRWLDRASSTNVVGSTAVMAPSVDGDADYNTGRYVYVPGRELILFIRRAYGAVKISYMDVSVSSPSKGGDATLSQTLPLDPFAGGGKHSNWVCAEWCPDNNRLLIGKVLNGPGDLMAGTATLDTGAIYEIEIPAVLTDAWTVTRRSFSGVTSIDWDTTVVPGSDVVNSFQPPIYLPKLKCLVMFDRARKASDTPAVDKVLVYRPHGT